MKFVHISDTHFNAKDDIENAFIINNFKRIQNYSISNNIHHIIISGDIFDDSSVNLKYRELFSNNKLNYYIIPGNHDNEDNLLSFFSYMDNVIYFGDKPYTKSLVGNTMIYGVPYNDNIKPLELFSKISNDIVTTKSEKNIILLHGSPVGVNFGVIDTDEAKIKHFPIDFEDMLPLIYIKKNIYIALGHYHKSFRDWKFDRVLCCMPGSIYPFSLKDKDERCFSVYDSDNHQISKISIKGITNLIYKYFFISPFEINLLYKNISESIKNAKEISKVIIRIDGYISDIKKIDEIQKEIESIWSKNHKIPIEWKINVSVIESLKPEIKNILDSVSDLGKENSISDEVMVKAKKLIFESYKGIK